jgi:hypothetical protein
LQLDFRITPDPTSPRRMLFEVEPGGFPRAFADQIRFTFGDGNSGWGEVLSHSYRRPGIYSVDLEVRLRNRVTLRKSKLAVIEPVPEAQRIAELTLNRIPDYLNGSIPISSDNWTPRDTRDDYTAPFHLLVPTHGFTVDVTRYILGQPIRLTHEGRELTNKLIGPDHQLSWTVSPEEAFPEGMVTLRLEAGTQTSTLTFEAVSLTPAIDPFDRPMIWVFRFDMDLFTTTATRTFRGENGVPDFEDELGQVGLAAHRRKIQEYVRDETYRFFDGIPLAIELTPRSEPFDPLGEVSIMRLGGILEGNLGRSRFSPHNERRVDDSLHDLGVGTSRLVQLVAGAPGIREAFDPLDPDSETGVPAGEHPLDGEILSPAFDRFDPTNDPAANERHDLIDRAARLLAKAIASVAAHEMGHAMGLVPNGLPPNGFFGDRDDVSFIGKEHTDSHHVDFPGLNLMQAGGNPLNLIADALGTVEYEEDASLLEAFEIFAGENRLSAYERAYLERRLTYRRFD